ncbi:MAG: LptA/OstA family protein, partial [Terriglobia bacterium]
GTAAKLTALVDPATSQIRKLVASGSVRLAVQKATDGGDRRLFAQTAQVNFGPTGKAQTGFASGQVRMVYVPTAGARKEPQPCSEKFGQDPLTRRFAPPSPPRGRGCNTHLFMLRGVAERRDRPPFRQLGARVLTASKLTFTFQAGGNVKEAHTIGPGKIVSMPLRPGADRQIITAGQFLASFDSMGRMVLLLGISNTKVLDQASPDAPPGRIPRESTSQNLKAVFDPSTGSAEVVTQTGMFQFRQGGLRASAHASEYHPGTQEMTLSGQPVIWDPDGRIHAEHMEFNLSSGLAHGWGNVQASEFATQSARPDPKPSQDKQAAPLIILSDRVLDNRNTRFTRFEGHVRAWDGPDVLQSSSLDLYQKARRASSGFGVVTSLLSSASLTGSGGSGKKSGHSQPRAEQPTVIRADHLVYFDVRERAVYRGHVQVTSGNTTLHSNSLNVSFSKAAGGEPVLSRAVAVGDVIVTQPGRRATGQQADYFAASGKIVLTGGPPAIYDENQGFLTARRLTFSVHDASLFADGGTKAPALSKRRIQRQ